MKLNGLRQKFVAAVGALGGVGIFLIAFLDSSVLTFPVVNDLLIVDFSIRNPLRMPFYALMATLGSVLGCVLLYFLARKGGQALFHKRAGRHAGSIQRWIDRNGFLSILIAALLPPPTPFKIFVIAAGVFEVPLRTFALALTLARAFRYFGEGYLAIRYGPAALHYLTQHKLVVALIAVGLVAASYLASRIFLGRRADDRVDDRADRA